MFCKNTQIPNNISFGYGKGLRKLIAKEYPYCAYTGVKYGTKKNSSATTDHVVAEHYEGASNNANYIVVAKFVNIKKKCTSLRKFISMDKSILDNINNYFEALLKSTNPRVVKYAKTALNTVLNEIRGMSSPINRI